MLIGTLSEPTLNRDGTWNLTVSGVQDFSELYEELKGNRIRVDIRKYHPGRSLTANAYAWELIDEIATKLRLPKPDIYRSAIQEIGGVSFTAEMLTEAIPTFRQIWEKGHTGRQVIVIPGNTDPVSEIVRVYYGSSDYDTAQMSRLIDSLIQEAESLGIPTLPDPDRQKLIDKWKPQVII